MSALDLSFRRWVGGCRRLPVAHPCRCQKMTAKEFIDALKVVVHDSAIRGMETTLRKPSGRHPAPSIVAVSNWFVSLSGENQEMVRSVIRHSVHSALFGVLTVLDGVLAIENRQDKGQLLLSFEDADGTVRLNDPHGEMLHDIYQSKVYDEVFGKKG
jgi:hypothetical protein